MSTKKAATVRPDDTRQTIQLCVELLSSSLRRINPEDHDPNVVNALASCARCLTLHPQSPPLEPASKAMARLDKTVPPQRGQWSYLPFELLSRILRLRRAAERELPFPVYEDQDGDHPTVQPTAARDTYACSLYSDSKPFFDKLVGLRGLTLTSQDDCEYRTASYEILELLVCEIFPRLNFTSPLLTALDMGRYYGCRCGIVLDEENLAVCASTIARLRFLRVPEFFNLADPSFEEWDDDPLRSVNGMLGPALRCWAPDSCSPDDGIIAPSLPRLECIKFPTERVCDHVVSGTFMHKLISLQPPLRCVILQFTYLHSEDLLINLLAACSTIQELDLCDCDPITDRTLAALENHPPLRSLNLSYQSKITVPAIVSLLRARGSELRFLGLNWFGAAAFEVLASYAPKMQHITITECSRWERPSFSCENLQFLMGLVHACTRLETFPPVELKSIRGADGIVAFLKGLGVAYRAIDLFENWLAGSYWFAGVAS
ncbi:hypothetical protein BDK51DRAFT_32591 [Blyttiomyces helicus]|uniref:F-box domain-containing protein n=1 Tax=Blyttiomyces helicus TaxID=388810 RepID=A0A4P9WGI2_9FUNG|nr:hypothetical protein BDK51DRAFT_32591 [Blyttiomyces helicus]|eukprot:RKO91814.1 hypothetical protein BDK51DRAFT_32591 [Blyttiomyces helicus]